MSPIFGKVRSSAATSIRQSSLSDIVTRGLNSYDSIVFEIVVTYLYGKRSGEFSLKVHPLSDPLLSTKAYVSNIEPSYNESIEVLSSSFSLSGKLPDSIRIHANTDWSDEFFAKVTGNESTDFLLNYPGLLFTLAPESEAILGLDVKATTMTIYYKSDPTDEASARSKVFDFSNLRYNYYEMDRSGALLDGLSHGQHTFSEHAYAQANSGVFCGIDLSAVHAFYKEKGGFTVNFAELNVGPLEDLSDSIYLLSPPSTLRLSLPYPTPTDSRNHSKALISRLIHNESSLLAGGTEYLVASADSPTLYKAQVASALQEAILSDEPQGYWLLSALNYDGFEPIILPSSQVELTIYYTP